ncbi:unnamed protein product [Rotaria socialis]|uniref:P-type phospholipid transporter n=1 Tax=Rotaria socialis TaxID=392032 RepID=A0A818CMJ1_9BILA|nr:unnamed protein product [Rotaria socialis]CAF4228735.1 unnamed protein product [Rotaria socialis]
MSKLYSSIIAKYFDESHKTQPRNVIIGRPDLNTIRYPKNVIRNQKYSIITFIPLCLYEQFSVFLNLYFLIIGLSQFIPMFRVNYFFTYMAPLAFVVCVSMLREGYEDIKRAYRDREINSQIYTLLTENGHREEKLSSEIKVSDIIILRKNQRVPADILLLQTLDKSGTCFIRTDQLDGETDWKLRIATPMTQSLEDISILISDKSQTVKIHSEPPCLNIQEFNGVFSWKSEVPLSVENMLWSGTVIATGEVIGCVIYTGTDTRMVLNTSKPRHKFGLVDKEINTFAKLLFLGSATLALVLVILKGVDGLWYRYFVRFLLLLSYMVPLSLRVNLDLGKLVYSWFIQQDKDIPGSVVRSSTIPEELGRIGYLLADKTGTLTQNVMVFKRLKVGAVSYTIENKTKISNLLEEVYKKSEIVANESQESLVTSTSTKRSIGKNTETRDVTEAIKALALCHNVTPVLNNSAENMDEFLSTSDTPRTSVTSLNTTAGSDVLDLLPVIGELN